MKFKASDFKELLPEVVAKQVAIKATALYLTYIYQQPKLYGIITPKESYLGFNDHLGGYDNLVGYLAESEAIKK